MEGTPVASSKTHTPDPPANLTGPCNKEQGAISNAVKLNTLYNFHVFMPTHTQVPRCHLETGTLGLQVF